MSTKAAQRYLAGTWIAGFVLLTIVMFSQGVVFGIYGEYGERMWDWFRAATVPTVTLMLGVVVAEALSGDAPDTKADRLLFWAAMVLSLVYLGSLVVVSALVGFRFSIGPVDASLQYMEIQQGVLLVVLGAFFARRK